jgi:putative OPT family oligopeptide transporter
MIKDKNQFHPYIKESITLPEITFRAIVIGMALAAIIAGSIAYLGLKMGQTINASIPAAVISMAILRILGRGNILENNIIQTIASAGSVIAAGTIFTIPALVLMGYWQEFHYGKITLIAIIGGFLGVLFSIPLRRALILEEKLKFPEGLAAAEVLKGGDKIGSNQSTGISFLLSGSMLSSLFKFCQSGLHVVGENIQGWINLGGSVFGFSTSFTFAMLGAGYIVGMKVAVNLFVGAAIAWLISVPLYTAFGTPEDFGLSANASAYDWAMAIRMTKLRYIGVGTMVFGGLFTLFTLVKPIKSSITSSFRALQKSRIGKDAKILRTDYDIPITIVSLVIVAFSVVIFFLVKNIIGAANLPISQGLYWVIISFLWISSLFIGFLCAAIGGYMAGIVGSSANPLSGITIGAILAVSACLLLLLGSEINFGATSKESLNLAAVVVIIGALVATAATLSSDNLQDLKTGQVLGATPWKQQFMLLLGVIAGSLVIGFVLDILYNAYGLGDKFPRMGMETEHALAAPQATLMASVAMGVFSQSLDWPTVFIGLAIGLGIALVDQLILKPAKSEYRLSIMAIALGIYLPFEIITPFAIGGLVNFLAKKRLQSQKYKHGKNYSRVQENTERQGLLFASGLIAGDAIVGILLAIPFAAYQSTKIFTIVGPSFKETATILGCLVFIGICYHLYRIGWQAKSLETEI